MRDNEFSPTHLLRNPHSTSELAELLTERYNCVQNLHFFCAKNIFKCCSCTNSSYGLIQYKSFQFLLPSKISFTRVNPISQLPTLLPSRYIARPFSFPISFFPTQIDFFPPECKQTEKQTNEPSAPHLLYSSYSSLFACKRTCSKLISQVSSLIVN